jgi:hypothetical protein
MNSMNVTRRECVPLRSLHALARSIVFLLSLNCFVNEFWQAGAIWYRLSSRYSVIPSSPGQGNRAQLRIHFPRVETKAIPRADTIFASVSSRAVAAVAADDLQPPMGCLDTAGAGSHTGKETRASFTASYTNVFTSCGECRCVRVCHAVPAAAATPQTVRAAAGNSCNCWVSGKYKYGSKSQTVAGSFCGRPSKPKSALQQLADTVSASVCVCGGGGSSCLP